MYRYLLFITVVFITACLPDKDNDKASPIVFERETIRIVSENRKNRPIVLNVEIADTDPKRMRGLMYRTELADDAGMLFMFPSPRQISMWMANTPISLDMIFINEQGVIKEIVENTIPFSHDIIRSEKKASGVLEIKGGQAKHFRLETGDIVEHPFFKLEKRP